MLTWLGYIDGIHVTIYSIHGSVMGKENEHRKWWRIWWTGIPFQLAEIAESDRLQSGWWFRTWLLWLSIYCFYFSIQLGIIIPTDEHIFFQRGRYTTNQRNIVGISLGTWTIWYFHLNWYFRSHRFPHLMGKMNMVCKMIGYTMTIS